MTNKWKMAIISLAVASVMLLACAPSAAPPATPPPTTAPAPKTEAAKPTTAPAPKTEAPKPAADRLTTLIEGAKKEGKLTIWTTDAGKEANEYLKVFKNKYPFLEVEVWTSNNEAIVEKMLAEAKAGKYTPDFSTTGVAYFGRLKEAGLVKKYDWPETKAWGDPRLRDPEGYWGAKDTTTTTIVYNKNLVSAADAPKSWEDLYNPKWKGQLAIDQEATEWALQLYSLWGKEKTFDYLQKVAKNEPLLKKGHTAITEMLAAGEFKIACELLLYKTMDYIKKGAPIEWVRSDPILTRVGRILLPEKAPHPNASQLYADWFTSLDGQQTYYNATGRGAAHPQVKSAYNDAIKSLNQWIIPSEYELKATDAEEMFRQVFWAKK